MSLMVSYVTTILWSWKWPCNLSFDMKVFVGSSIFQTSSSEDNFMLLCSPLHVLFVYGERNNDWVSLFSSVLVYFLKSYYLWCINLNENLFLFKNGYSINNLEDIYSVSFFSTATCVNYFVVCFCSLSITSYI